MYWSEAVTKERAEAVDVDNADDDADDDDVDSTVIREQLCNTLRSSSLAW